MNTAYLKDKFEAMGARLKLGELRPRRWQRLNDAVSFTVDIKTDKRGEFFELLVRPDREPEFLVLDLRPKDRHLLLLSKEVRDPKRGRDGVDLSRFLCGHDERHWFVAAVPGTASSVHDAMEALKPEAVHESQARHKVKTKRRNKRKKEGFIRQGEWFFVPYPDMAVGEPFVLKNEPLRRGRVRPRIAEFLYRRGSTTVHVCDQYPNGLTQGEYTRLVREDPGKAKLNWRTMSRDPEAFVKGKDPPPGSQDCGFAVLAPCSAERGITGRRFLGHGFRPPR